MPGYVVEIRHQSLGSGPAKLEVVYALGETEAAALVLVKTALRLDDEDLHVARVLSELEIRTIGIRPFQVRHAAAA